MSRSLSLRRGRLAVLVSLVLSSTMALAQDPSPGNADAPAARDPVDLDTVRVNAYRTTTHTSGATKTDTPIAETAQSVSVIAREELDARGAGHVQAGRRYPLCRLRRDSG